MVVCLVVVLSLVLPSALAQDDLTETFVDENGVFTVMYPAGWVEATSGDLPTLSNGATGADNITIGFIGPADIPTGSSAQDILEAVQTDMDFEGEVAPATVDGREAATLSVDQGASSGFFLVIQFENGDYGLMAALGDIDTLDANIDLIMDMAETFNNVGATGDTSDKPQTLNNHDAADWRDAVAELEAEGLIASGGTLVFNENSAYFSGQGYHFTALAKNQPFTDIVMAGTLSFTVGDTSEFEACILTARIVTNSQGSAVEFVDGGITNEGEVYVADRFAVDDGFDYIEEYVGETVSLDEEHHLLMLLQGNKMTLYLNGQLVIDGFEIVERAGIYGIALVGKGPNASCQGSNIWVFEAPVFEPGVCKVSSTGTVNKRSGPGTNFDRAGTLTAGVTLDVVGQASPGDGFVWWKLEDDSWVREDVVNVRGDCANMPEVED